MAIRSAIVTIEDPVAPLISEPAGELVQSGWLSGTKGVTFGGSDVTGIRQVGIYRDGAGVVVRDAPAAEAGGCGQLNSGLAYTYTKPCEGARGVNGPQAFDVDTRMLPEGTSRLDLVVRDTAGNATSEDVTVRVDNTAPASPTVATAPGWSASETAAWTWTLPPEVDRAPVERVEVEVCPAGGQSCAVETLAGAATQTERAVPEGESSLRVRLTDAAGNVGEWSEPAVARRDRTAPRISVTAPATARTDEPVAPTVEASDDTSGIASRPVEVRAGDGAWRAAKDFEWHPAGTTLRFRARATDQAGNDSGWTESGDVLVVASPALVPTVVPTVTPPLPTPAPNPTPHPVDPPRRARTTIADLRMRPRRGRLVLTGRVRPGAATGSITVTLRGKARRTRVRGGRFVLTIPAPARPARATVRYSGDAAHAPSQRRLRLSPPKRA